jgi:hypothetical protein
MSKLGKFSRLSGVERRLFLEAVGWCAVVRLTMLLVPFRKYASLLGVPLEKSSVNCVASVAINKQYLPEQIGLAVRRASRSVPWETRCFVEAIAAKRMLKRRNIPCTIYLGLKKIEIIKEGEYMEDIAAHAWIACGDIIVAGRQGVKLEQYTVVSAFK